MKRPFSEEVKAANKASLTDFETALIDYLKTRREMAQKELFQIDAILCQLGDFKSMKELRELIERKLAIPPSEASR